jgi:hypothetical protein
MLQSDQFFQWHLSNVVEIGLFVVGMAGYGLSRSTENRERREQQAARLELEKKALETQTRMHTENSERLGVLMKFHEAQNLINEKRDQQISQLTSLASANSEIMKAALRRLELIENRFGDRK